MKTLFLFLLLIFLFTHLNSQAQFEEGDFVPPHPDSLGELIEGVDIQFYKGGEAYVIKHKNIYLPEAIELAKGFSEIYGTGYNAVPMEFDTNIKPDVHKLPPLARQNDTGGLAKTADTSLCNQIIWSEPMLLFEGRSFMSVAVVGDTVHAVTGINKDIVREQPYRRSFDGGKTFEDMKNLIDDSLNRYPGSGWTRILLNGNKVFLLMSLGDTIPGGGLRPYTGYMVSTDGGNTFSQRKKLVEYESGPADVSSSGDTIAVVIGDSRWTRGTPVPMYIYISTNFGETWKFRGYAGGRRVYDPRIALAGGWLHQTNRYFPPGRWTRSEVAYYRSRVMRKTWLRRQVLSTNDGISSIQGDPVAEPNGFVGVIWNDGKYGSNFGHDGTAIFRRSHDFGKTFEPEVRLTDSPETGWGVMKLKPIATKLPVIAAVWSATLENEYNITNAIRISLNGGSNWCPVLYQNIRDFSPNIAIGRGKVYWAIRSSLVVGILPENIQSETIQSRKEPEEVLSDIKIENYPNPYNSATTINYEILEAGFVSLKVYDVLGREVKVLIDNEYKEEGEYEVKFSSKDEYTSGVYYYQISLRNKDGIKTKVGKMLFMK